MLFIFVAAYLSIQEFISLMAAIKSPEFERGPIGTSIVIAFELLSIAIFIWLIFYVYRKKLYFVNR